MPVNGGSADTTKFLRGDNTWVVPPATDISGKADLSGDTFTGNVDFDSGIDVTGNITTTGTLQAKALRFGETHVKRISVDYTGEATHHGQVDENGNPVTDGSNYLNDNEFQEILTITPDGNSENYSIIGRIMCTSGGNSHTLDINIFLRSNTLDGTGNNDLSYSGTYISTIAGSHEYLTPRIWVKQTTTAAFKLVVEINERIYGRLNADLEIITRNENDLDNVVVNEDETSEVIAVTAGYTQHATLPTKIYETDDGAFTFNSDLTFNGDDYNVKWDKSEDYLKFDDDAMAVFGDSADLRIYHTGNESWIKESGTGNLYIANSGLHVVNAANTKNVIRTIDDGAVQLFHNGTERLATSAGGVDISGLLLTEMEAQDHSGDLSVRANTHCGFYQHNSATTGEYWPETTDTWYHLIANTHDSTSNHYSQQLASPFFDDNNGAYALYHRNTGNSGTRDWQKLYG